MKLNQLVQELPLAVLSGQDSLEAEVTGGYASDLLSNVMGQASAGNVWITMQGHQNIVAVATLLGLSGIILASGVKPDEDTLRKAREQNIALLSSTDSTFTIAGKLFQWGIGGV